MQFIGAALINDAADLGHQPNCFVRRELGLAQRPVGMLECRDDTEVGGVVRDPQMSVDPADG